MMVETPGRHARPRTHLPVTAVHYNDVAITLYRQMSCLCSIMATPNTSTAVVLPWLSKLGKQILSPSRMTAAEDASPLLHLEGGGSTWVELNMKSGKTPSARTKKQCDFSTSRKDPKWALLPHRILGIASAPLMPPRVGLTTQRPPTTGT